MSSTGSKGRDLIRWNMSSYSACRNIVLSQYSSFTIYYNLSSLIVTDMPVTVREIVTDVKSTV